MHCRLHEYEELIKEGGALSIASATQDVAAVPRIHYHDNTKEVAELGIEAYSEGGGVNDYMPKNFATTIVKSMKVGKPQSQSSNSNSTHSQILFDTTKTKLVGC